MHVFGLWEEVTLFMWPYLYLFVEEDNDSSEDSDEDSDWDDDYDSDTEEGGAALDDNVCPAGQHRGVVNIPVH